MVCESGKILHGLRKEVAFERQRKQRKQGRSRGGEQRHKGDKPMTTFTVVKHQKVLNYYLAEIQAETKAQALRATFRQPDFAGLSQGCQSLGPIGHCESGPD